MSNPFEDSNTTHTYMTRARASNEVMISWDWKTRDFVFNYLISRKLERCIVCTAVILNAYLAASRICTIFIGKTPCCIVNRGRGLLSQANTGFPEASAVCTLSWTSATHILAQDRSDPMHGEIWWKQVWNLDNSESKSYHILLQWFLIWCKTFEPGKKLRYELN